MVKKDSMKTDKKIENKIKEILQRYGTWEVLENIEVKADGTLRVERGAGYNSFENCLKEINTEVQAECEKYARERVLNQYSDKDKGYYTGYCDRDGVKIYTGDVVRFEKTYPEGGVWEAEVVFDDGCPTVKTFENVKQVKNPDNWDKEHDWIKSRWWSVEVGYGEGGDWNCFRTPLNKLAGVFESSDEFFKARERFNKRYGKFHSNDNLYRPLPIKVVQNFKKEQRHE